MFSDSCVRDGSGILFPSSLSEAETRKEKDIADDPTPIFFGGTPKPKQIKTGIELEI